MAFPFLNDPLPPVPAPSASVIRGKNYRFTVLTERLVRIEYDETGAFEDRPTQITVNRNFETPRFSLTEDDRDIQIRTDYFELRYRKGPFTPYSLSVEKLGGYSNHDNIWHYGETPPTLKGTSRTLDKADGAIALEEGLCARAGFAVLDDSSSLVIREDGWVDRRREGVTDIYYFAYGHDFRACIRDFYRLTGAPPLLPRYALGNWWSRYFAYTQEGYQELMERFAEKDMPFSVAVLDMDWHVTNIEERYGRGWTGYTWNTELFPDHPALLRWLHDRHLRVTLNLHPADGIKAFEKMYRPMAEALEVDTEKEDPIPFDVSDRNFMAAYFKFLHHPLEAEGVDFWWIDWQSGNISRTEGLDPLWMLNHYHTLDIARDGKRPLIFSRYSGPGSHRYPVGFSGDTCITWDSLDFQPYFTATASNIGYGWWSHDIGGHMKGYKDNELMVRWLQYGVFSPVNRLHCSNSPFTSKEPWNYGPEAEAVMGRYLRLRHELVPYIYTMNRRCTAELEPLVQPMYYSHPEHKEAYTHPNQYWFGSELVIAPITGPALRETRRAAADVWLPEGTWTDIFTGTVYRGGKTIRVWRPLSEYPVFAKAGAILPLARREPGSNCIDNPAELELLVFPGGDGTFTLYEDSGEGAVGSRFAETEIRLTAGNTVSLSISPRGDLSVLPQSRRYCVRFRGFKDPGDLQGFRAESGGEVLDAVCRYDSAARTLEVDLPALPVSREITITAGTLRQAEALYRDAFISILEDMQISYELKDEILRILGTAESPQDLLASISAAADDPNVISVLAEMICA
ncbi:glycoside hydrolase family 31 protein [Breznakiella homolactica]|uniref:DUF5110 domain-containing protein n=1 Tax=Breznakiella homolactica TaxID=2798577 RepID=A0A7T7XMU3_9SPIR|nr:glycoside hydrolase family 31 protein [Breznakiella homolactica]QQO09177.1 glycoside hydrolase family 31 protein [Breznakiella homolactica]